MLQTHEAKDLKKEQANRQKSKKAGDKKLQAKPGKTGNSKH